MWSRARRGWLTRPEPWLFLAAFAAYAWFHQGGGWNQNSRFAMVRALVEERRPWIDSFLVYERSPGGALVRRPAQGTRCVMSSGAVDLAWSDPAGRPVPVDAAAHDPSVPLRSLEEIGIGADVAWAGGHFHPNKAPGTSLFAVPAYAALHLLGRAGAADADEWWTMTRNAWLTTVFSIGLLAAVGVVVFYRLALSLSGDRRRSLAAALTLAFATMYFPYATVLVEHDLVAVALLAAFALLRRARSSDAGARAAIFPAVLAGACAGGAVLGNYAMAAALLVLGVYAAGAPRRRHALAGFALGAAVPLLVLAAYNVACFGHVATTNYSAENPAFRDSSRVLSVFGPPSPGVLLALLFSPFRGLFVSAPVLLLAVPGGIVLWRRARAEAVVCAALFALFLGVNVCFNGWHGGWTAFPRYLAPALPFLVLPIVFAYVRLPVATGVLAVLSAGVMLVATAVDMQCPVGVAQQGMIPGLPPWRHDPLLDYELPLFRGERPWTVLRAQERAVLDLFDGQAAAGGVPARARQAQRAAAQAILDDALREGRPAPLLVVDTPSGRTAVVSDLPTVSGPVSANRVGVYEGHRDQLFPAGSPPVRWSAFNAGEFFFPERRLSLLPLLALEALLLGAAFRAVRIRDAERAGPGGPAPA